jgi:C_GCAxxG_C_C family probable redox protein
MESRKAIAEEKKRCGSHNCTQAVLSTYSDIVGMDEDTLMRIGGSFAAGMGNMEGTCGALVGAGIIVGLSTADKVKAMKLTGDIMNKFQGLNGATQCRMLKGIGTGKVLRSCLGCVADASQLLEEALKLK